MFGLMKIAESATSRAEVGDECCAHQELADLGIGQATLDQHRIDDRQRGRRERRARDQRRATAPVEREIRDERSDDERANERHDPDPDRWPQPPPHVARVDLHPGQKRQNDRREPGNQRQPVLRLQVEDVADRNAERRARQERR